MSHFRETHLPEAMQILRRELTNFSYDGLTALEKDLLDQQVTRGSWEGCVLSYARGDAGSSRRDSLGWAKNAFTVLWDDGRISEEEVLDAVRQERIRRTQNLPVHTVARTFEQG